MPLHMPFNFPSFYNYNYKKYPNYASQPYNHNINLTNNIKSIPQNINQKSENSDPPRKDSESSNCFFEIFGLKLYFDDVLIICILFFLYKQEVHDEELFVCLILLLLS